MRKATKAAIATSAALLGAALIPGIATAEGQNEVRPGTPIFNDGGRCTMGIVGTANKDDVGQVGIGITAGHCGEVGDKLTFGSGSPLGTVVASHTDNMLTILGNDWAAVELDPGVKPVSTTTNGQKITGTEDVDLWFGDLGRPVTNDGSTTGPGNNGIILFNTGNEIVHTAIPLPGDSGGPISSGDTTVGIVSRLSLLPPLPVSQNAGAAIEQFNNLGGYGDFVFS